MVVVQQAKEEEMVECKDEEEKEYMEGIRRRAIR